MALNREIIETMSTQDLKDLLPILMIAEPELCATIRIELCMRQSRFCYEGCGGA